MLMVCDFCESAFSKMAKIPCGYYIEREKSTVLLVMPMPSDELAYRNICMNCMLQDEDEYQK